MSRALIERGPASSTPVLLRVALMLGVPFIGAITVAGTYLGKEIVITAAFVALSLGGFLFIRPVIGIAAMTGEFLLAAYPTLLQALGFLTINNLLGICFVVLVAGYILETRDLSFLKIKQIRILMFIGLLFWIGSMYSEVLFPMLVETRGKGKVIDKTDFMAHNFIARLVFLAFFCIFVRTRRDIKLIFITFTIALFVAIPSALWNMASGELNRGFRAAASFTSGSNPNRLAMICLIEIACWWFWMHAKPGTWRRLWGLAAIAMSVMVLLGTGSRSGLLGGGLLLLLLQTGPRSYRASTPQLGLLFTVGFVAIVTIVPAASWERMITFNPEKGEIAASSNKMREETVERAWQVFVDYPWTGVGIGNFREVTRQIYLDKFFRPPHNSYLWAASEGGIFVVMTYLWLFWVTWKDIQGVRQMGHRDPELASQAESIRVVFIMYAFFCGFADLWINPITYVMLGQVVTMRRYFESLPDVQPAAVLVQTRAVGRRVARAAA